MDLRGLTTSVNIVSSIGDSTSARGNVAFDTRSVERFFLPGFGNNLANFSASAIGVEVIGDLGNDVITGSDFNDVLRGGIGADALTGNGGRDELYGEEGPDTFFVRYTPGEPVPGGLIDGGFGVDVVTLSGDGISADLSAGVVRIGPATVNITGVENVRASPPSATGPAIVLIGDAANNTFTVDNPFAAVDFDGRDGDDVLQAADGVDRLRGGRGADRLEGRGDADQLFGEDGDDLLLGGAGDDRLDGGAGADTASYEDATSPVAVDLALGAATGARSGFDTLIGVENARGTDGDDTLAGDANANRLEGRGGVDVLTGLGGADQLDGGAGDDRLVGGDGDDLLVGGLGADVIDGGAGRDRVLVSVLREADVITLGSGSDVIVVEDRQGLFPGLIRVTDFAAGDGGDVLSLVAIPFVDLFTGENPFSTGALSLVQQGSDTLLQFTRFSGPPQTLITLENVDRFALTPANFGGFDPGRRVLGTEGNDDLRLGEAGDEARGAGGDDSIAGNGSGFDTVDYSAVSAGVRVSLAAAGLQATGGSGNDGLVHIEALRGSPFADELTGDWGDNRLEGGAGADYLGGGAGRDSLHGDAGADFIEGGADDDQQFGGDGDDLMGGQAGADYLNGGNGRDALYGDAGNDFIEG